MLTPAARMRRIPILPLHLTLSLMQWLSVNAASLGSKDAWTPWNSPSQPWSRVPPPAIPPAVAPQVRAAANEKLSRLLSGTRAYLHHPYRRSIKEPPAIWRCGSCRLLDYGALPGPEMEGGVILIVPSLINRYYILDLQEEKSLLRYLRMQGLRPMMLDWGTPGEEEKDFDCARYVKDRLLPVLEWLNHHFNKTSYVLGYCMGGLLALAAAQLAPQHVRALALLATPWDFSVPEYGSFQLSPRGIAALHTLISSAEYVPAEAVQAVFWYLNPGIFTKKFERFAALNAEGPAAEHFVALEEWVNDGVPMARGVAKDCFIHWAQENRPIRERWKVGGETISPERVDAPSFVALPVRDHIVPHSSAWPLSQLLPNTTLCSPQGGHVSMIVGRSARKDLWQPLACWLKQQSSAKKSGH